MGIDITQESKNDHLKKVSEYINKGLVLIEKEDDSEEEVDKVVGKFKEVLANVEA